MRMLLFALALVSLSFAAGEAPDWVPLAMLAVFAGLGVLLIFFLLSYLVDAEQMRAMVIGEMWQVVITGVMIAAFLGAEGLAVTIFAPALGEAFGGEGLTHMQYAQMLTAEVRNELWDGLNGFVEDVVLPMGGLASVGGNCYLFGVSYTYAGCASINVPFSSATFAARVMSTAVLAMNSQLFLLNLAASFLFPVLLPFGLFLRCFHVTRGTGGFLIAFSFAFYFIYPLSILVTKGMLDMAEVPEPSYPGIEYPTVEDTWGLLDALTEWDVPGDCDPFAMDFSYTKDQINHLIRIDHPEDPMTDSLLYMFFFGGLFSPALSLVITLSTLRTLSRVFGTEVDVSALARIS